MQQKIFYPYDRLRAERRSAKPEQSLSGEAQPYLPHVTRSVPKSVHAKFHADWSKARGARGIYIQTHSSFCYIDFDACCMKQENTSPPPLVVLIHPKNMLYRRVVITPGPGDTQKH